MTGLHKPVKHARCSSTRRFLLLVLSSLADKNLRKKFPGQMSSKYLDLVKYAYWSCLQLERYICLVLEHSGSCANWGNSDILAEMQLPQSGISRYETFMNAYLPSGIQSSDEEHGVYQTDQSIRAVEVKYYCAQIALRVTLNSIHNQLYDKHRPSEYAPILVTGVVWTASAADTDRLQNYNSRFKSL